MTLTQTELAELFDVSTRTIQRWTSDGMPRRSDGDYDATACIKWRLDEEARRIERRLDADAYDLARTRKMEAEADRVELENAKRLGRLIDVDEAVELLDRPLRQVAASVKNAPARYASELAKLAGVEKAVAKRFLDTVAQSIIDDLRRVRHPEEEANGE